MGSDARALSRSLLDLCRMRKLTIATADPLRTDWMPEIAKVSRREVKLVMASPLDISQYTAQFFALAKSIKGAAKAVVEQFRGKVPQTMDELLHLSGVARKTANVVLGSWFKIAVGVVVDTHVMRLSRRLELTKETAPERVEKDLMQIIPQERWINFSHELIHHGRQKRQQKQQQQQARGDQPC